MVVCRQERSMMHDSYCLLVAGSTVAFQLCLCCSHQTPRTYHIYPGQQQVELIEWTPLALVKLPCMAAIPRSWEASGVCKLWCDTVCDTTFVSCH